MRVVDASVIYEVLSLGPAAGQARSVLADGEDFAAPQLLDVEVLGLLRRDSLNGSLDGAVAESGVLALAEWPGERFGMQPFIDRVWVLRHTVRTWDAFYVALAEALSCPLVTMDRRLASATGPQCQIDVIG